MLVRAHLSPCAAPCMILVLSVAVDSSENMYGLRCHAERGETGKD